MSEIKTAEQRIHKLEGGEGDSFVTVEQALIAERDELRKALAERDAEIVSLHSQWEQSRNETDAAHTHLTAQRLVMQQALDALEIVEWNGGTQQWVKKTGSEAIDALKEALK